MDEEAFEATDGAEASAHVLPAHVQSTFDAVWQRAIEAGGRQELSLEEAAALLGASIESVRRRARGGTVRAIKDRHGRIRVSASVTYVPAIESMPAEMVTGSDAVSRLWSELQEAREQLGEARATNRSLREELEATEAALEYTKGEVANLWRVVTSRNESRPPEQTRGTSRLNAERQRIQGKIASMRDIARRRRFPWSMAG